MKSLRHNASRLLALLLAVLWVISPALAMPCPMARQSAATVAADAATAVQPSTCCAKSQPGDSGAQRPVDSQHGGAPVPTPVKHKSCSQCSQCCCAPGVSGVPSVGMICLSPTAQRRLTSPSMLAADNAALDGVFQPPRS